MPARGRTCTIALAALLTSVVAAQAFDDAVYPDFSGLWRPVWLRGGDSQPSFDPTKPWGRAQQAPLTPEYQAIHEASLADQAKGGQGNWQSGARCMPPGMPATMTIYGEMEMVILPEVTHILLDHNTGYHRRIYTDGRDWPAEAEPTYQGYSIGRWIDEKGDGHFNVLQVETRFLKAGRALDPTGIPTHVDNQSVVRERLFRDATDPARMHDEITLIDHALTHPWTVLKTYQRDPRPRPIFAEQNCMEENSNIIIGKEAYWLGADRQLLPTRKDQPPPDLRYFKQTQK
jgi:hypothetical protein